MTAEDFNDIEWSKFFMAAAMGLVMIIQAWHGIEIRDAHEKADSAHAKADATREKIVPRAEYERRDEILMLIKSLNLRMEKEEANNDQ